VGACGFEKAIDITTNVTRVEYGKLGFAEVRDALEEGLKFSPEWLATHWDPARAAGWTGASLAAQLKQKFPLGLAPRTLDPLYVCEDADYLEELRTDANIRTAFSGVCLDQRKWYGDTTRAYCGFMPAKPHLLTVEEHAGTVPDRPAAWCAMQNWSGTTLPKP
jgi:hypothetical protein